MVSYISMVFCFIGFYGFEEIRGYVKEYVTECNMSLRRDLWCWKTSRILNFSTRTEIVTFVFELDELEFEENHFENSTSRNHLNKYRIQNKNTVIKIRSIFQILEFKVVSFITWDWVRQCLTRRFIKVKELTFENKYSKLRVLRDSHWENNRNSSRYYDNS